VALWGDVRPTVPSNARRGRSLARGLAEYDLGAFAPVRILIAYGALLYVTPELWYLPEQPVPPMPAPSFHSSASFVRTNTRYGGVSAWPRKAFLMKMR
jgi:hypothetical protein